MTKLDLVTAENQKKLSQYIKDYQKLGYTVLETSSVTAGGIEGLVPYLEGKTSVFAGQSGVGKSSLLNAINPDLALKTDDISSHLGRGKHTTRHVELIHIGSGLVADTPGSVHLNSWKWKLNGYLIASRKCISMGKTVNSVPACTIKNRSVQ